MKARKHELAAPAALQILQEDENTLFLRSADVCRLLNISNPTLKNLRRDRLIPFYKLGGTYLYKREEIMAYLEQCRNKL